MPIDDSLHSTPSPVSSPVDPSKDSASSATWPELLQASQEQVTLGLQLIQGVPAQVEAVAPPSLVAGSFVAPAETLAMATVVAGPEACAEAIHALVPLVPRVLEEFAPGVNATNRVEAIHLLAFFNTAQCSGAQLSPVRGALPRAVFAAERTWPGELAGHLAELSERQRERVAYAALAVGEIELVPALLGGEPLPEAFVPESEVDPRPGPFLRYLATAVRDIAPREEVEPVWLAMAESFPEQVAAGTMDWAELIYAARIYLTRFRGDSLSTVTNSMHKLVSSG